MRNLITYEEISELARPCTADRELAEAFIAEAQRVEVKPRLGDALYMRLLRDIETEIVITGGTATVVSGVVIDATPGAVTTDEGLDPYDMLLIGGKWTDSCGRPRLLTGVKTALAYYVLARIIRDGNIQATTYGAVVKDDQYSSDPERAERQRQYREIFAQADTYMAEVVDFIRQNCDFFPEYHVQGKMRSNRSTFRIIGK